ncbi:MAG: hypothetical protein R3D57_16435 [Hyphomicrobiaceae bacterium]
MTTTETIRESIIIRVDFVRAGAARPARSQSGSADVVDFEAARLARATVETGPRPVPKPRRPRGEFPGGFGGPF